MTKYLIDHNDPFTMIHSGNPWRDDYRDNYTRMGPSFQNGDWTRISYEIGRVNPRFMGMSGRDLAELIEVFHQVTGTNTAAKTKYEDLFHQAMERLEILLDGIIPDDPDVEFLFKEWRDSIASV